MEQTKDGWGTDLVERTPLSRLLCQSRQDAMSPGPKWRFRSGLALPLG